MRAIGALTLHWPRGRALEHVAMMLIARIRLLMFTIGASGPLGRVDFEWSTDDLADSAEETLPWRDQKECRSERRRSVSVARVRARSEPGRH
jgi:hypothetical protein